MDFELSPIELDRQIARAFAQWRGWRRRLDQKADVEDDPLSYFRPILGRSFFARLGELSETDPLREPLRRWIYRLSEQRINHAALTELASEWQRERPHPDTPGRHVLSALTLRERCLSDPPRRPIWMRLWLSAAPSISSASVELWQRRREVARRMGLAGPEVVESPAPNMLELARRVAGATRERMRELGAKSPAALIELVLGRDIGGNWPGRITSGHLLDYFRDSDLLRSLELEPSALPSSLGAASTARALGQLGAAWHEALAPRDQPFVVAHEPYGLARHTSRATFELLPSNQRFLARHFDVPSHAYADVQRRLAQIGLFELARAAFRVQLRPYALENERAFREAFAELAERDLCLSLPRDAAGVPFALGIEDEQRLAGLLLGARQAQVFIDTHDEDWFRNPRAIEQWRAEASLPPRSSVTEDTLGNATTLALRQLELLLR